MTLGPPRPLAAMSLRYPPAVSLKFRFGNRKFGWLKMLKVSHRTWTNLRSSPTLNLFNRLRLIACKPGPSRILRPEFPGAKGTKPYWSGEQFVRLMQPGTCTKAEGSYQG